MSSNFTGQCLCGDIAYEGASEPGFQANCHCDDCRRITGSAYGSLVFVTLDSLTVTKGETATYEHKSDTGNTMTKHFCGNCGSQLFSDNGAHPERRGIRVGTIDDASWFQPKANVFGSRKLPSTPLDENVTAFDKMPG
jgi:hypothetical protein